MENKFKLTIAILAVFSLLLAGCYQEQHFDMPGTGEGIVIPTDSMPDPFDGSGRIYLVKDGVPDFTKMSVMGFTDFAVEMPANPDTLSWRQGYDRNGKLFFGCRQHMINHALNNTDNYGGNPLSYVYNALYSRVYLKNGAQKNWKVTARVAMEIFDNNALSTFAFEGAGAWIDRTAFGFDWTSSSTPYFHMLRKTSLLAPLDGGNVVNMADYMSPCEPFEMTLCCVNNFFYVKMGEKTLWAYTAEDVADHEFPLVFIPWKGAVRFYDLSVEGDYEIKEPLAVQREAGYVNIQSPALADAGGNTLLFAEGRHEVAAQTSKLTSVRSNSTDIIMKYSSDEGNNWSDWTVLKGEDNGVYLRPSVINAGDKLYFFYTSDRNGKQDGDYRIEYKVSTDGGFSWSGENVVDATLSGYTVSTLSGHGIRTSDGKLVLPVQCRVGSRGTVAALYSEDQGASWHLGDVVSGLRNNSASILESDGKLIMYISHSSSGSSRKMTTSTDGGKTWTEPVLATIPTGLGGQQTGGTTVVDAGGVIYHFTPTNAEKASSFGGSSIADHPQTLIKGQKKLYIYKPEMELLGNGLTMTVSRDGGATWSEARDLVQVKSYEGYIFPTGAMDAVISGNTVVLVTEGGVAVPYEGLLIFREATN